MNWGPCLAALLLLGGCLGASPETTEGPEASNPGEGTIDSQSPTWTETSPAPTLTETPAIGYPFDSANQVQEWVIQPGSDLPGLAAAPWNPLRCDDTRTAQVPLKKVALDPNATLRTVNQILDLTISEKPGNGAWNGQAWEWVLVPVGTAHVYSDGVVWDLPWRRGEAAIAQLFNDTVAALPVPDHASIQGRFSPGLRMASQVIGGLHVGSLMAFFAWGDMARIGVGEVWDLAGNISLAPPDEGRLGQLQDCLWGTAPNAYTYDEPAPLGIKDNRLAWSRTRNVPSGGCAVQHQEVFVDALTGALLDSDQRGTVC